MSDLSLNPEACLSADRVVFKDLRGSDSNPEGQIISATLFCQLF